MTDSSFSSFSTCNELPECWDFGCAENLLLTKKSLKILEKVNPCNQQYHLLESSDGVSVFVTYQQKIDIFTYGFGRLRIHVTTIGIPCSVCAPGFQLTKQGIPKFKRALQEISGGVLVLNSPTYPLFSVCAQGTTLPTCELDIHELDFASYLRQMRSHYRYKIRKSMNHFNEVRTTVLADNNQFNGTLYALYEQVYQRSRFKLEKLPMAFFQQFPGTIAVFSSGDAILGFSQTILNNKELLFLFGGLDYTLNQKFHTYINLLLHIIQRGMAEGAHRVNLGQTAEGIKTRLGCRSHPKFLYARHSNKIYAFLIRRCIGLLSYNSPVDEPHVFK